jgi:hypothetical protein
MANFLAFLAFLACFGLVAVDALSSISIKGAKFFVDGEQFFIKGNCDIKYRCIALTIQKV